MSRIARFAMAAVLAAGSFLAVPETRAADFLVSQEPGAISLCAHPSYLRKITSRFRYQVTHVPYLPNVAITNFYNIRETRYVPVGYRHPIMRLYCGAKVILSDGSQSDIWYLIEGRMGLASIGENVEFCVSGFDRWFVYDGKCRVLR